MTNEINDKAYWDQFIDSLLNIIKDIESRYFQIERYKENLTWRERAYCYELYYQLRDHLKKFDFPYTLHGEIDKRGHGIICKKFKNKPNPDFVVHNPGTESNLVIMEVKPSDRIRKGNFENDMKKLKIFINDVSYRNGIFLIYGSDDPHLEKYKAIFKNISELLEDKKLLILWHNEVGKSPCYYSHSDNNWIPVVDQNRLS
jgi:hypothetical protein